MDCDNYFPELADELDEPELDKLGNDPWHIDIPASFLSNFLEEVENEFTPEKIQRLLIGVHGIRPFTFICMIGEFILKVTVLNLFRLR